MLRLLAKRVMTETRILFLFCSCFFLSEVKTYNLTLDSEHVSPTIESRPKIPVLKKVESQYLQQIDRHHVNRNFKSKDSPSIITYIFTIEAIDPQNQNNVPFVIYPDELQQLLTVISVAIGNPTSGYGLKFYTLDTLLVTANQI